MTQLSQDITKAFTRTYFVEDSAGVEAGVPVKAGTNVETQCLLVTDDNDLFVGVTASGQAYNKPVTVVEFGGYVIMTADKAISSVNQALYIDASAPARVTDTLSATPGTYWRIGFNKTTTAAAGDQVLVFVDPTPVVVS